MHGPHTILRSLVLIFLSGWVGVVVQPAEAQQTATLSGRVTDAAGHAVSGAFVGLFRQPGHIYTDGQDTDGNGAYRFSVPPGTYQLEVRPHGPFIAQRRELTLATDTTQNVVVETGVTLSGQVTGPGGQPPPWVYLSIQNEVGQEISFAWTDTGRYSLGVPMGTYQIRTLNDAFPDKIVEGVAITHDTVLNITLEAGVVLGGKVVDDEGQPVPARTGLCSPAHRTVGRRLLFQYRARGQLSAPSHAGSVCGHGPSTAPSPADPSPSGGRPSRGNSPCADSESAAHTVCA